MNAQDRPQSIKQFIIFVTIAYGIGLILFTLDFSKNLPSSGAFVAVLVAFTTVITFFFAYKIWQGRNWARIVYTVLFLIGIVFRHK